MVIPSVVGELDDLGPLDRRLLHVFVTGPGRGEGIAVALPGRGWLIVDGCRVQDGSFPIDQALSRWRADDEDPVEALVFTHPHDDHAAGIPRVIERHRPRRIAISVPDPPGPAFLAEVVAHSSSAGTTSNRLDADAVRSAAAAIQRWSVENPGALVTACDGVSLEVRSAATVSIRAPDVVALGTFMNARGLERRIRARGNEISAVVEVVFGATCVVLGGDLPRVRPGGKSTVKTGWDRVLHRHGHLGRHHGLKVPHHGSREAQHGGLMTTRVAEVAREWWVTPHNSSRLPRLAAGDGLDRLLVQQSPICLTALPAALSVQAAAPGAWRIQRDQLVRRLEAQATGDPFIDGGIELRPGSACGVLDAVWCGAFDDAGHLVGRWRGPAALELVST